MIYTIANNDQHFATVIKSNFKSTGIKFFTPAEYPQQLGYMNRTKGHVIEPHKHCAVEKTITHSFETLIVRSGKVKVIIYDENGDYFTETIITKGDIILIGNCGHGFEMLEDSEMIEIKQGPYLGQQDSTLLNNNATAASSLT